MNWAMNLYENGKNISCVTDEDTCEYVEKKPDCWVHADYHGWLNVDNVKFIDIAEDHLGNDVMTFEYKDRLFESNIVYGSKPE